MADYEVGYKRPPKDHQFKPGEVNNPGGKTSAQRKAEIQAAELAAIVSRDLVQAVHDTIKAAGNDAERLELVRSDTLTLLRDVQNRAHGSPKQQIDNTSSDGSMSPSRVSDEVLEALKRKHTSRSA